MRYFNANVIKFLFLVQSAQGFAPTKSASQSPQTSLYSAPPMEDSVLPGAADITFKPDTVVPKDTVSMQIWATISCNDSSGLTLDGLKKGDKVEIQSLSGIGSFTAKPLSRVEGIIGLIQGVVKVKNAAKALFDKDTQKKREVQFNKDSDKIKKNSPANGNKQRDGYGMKIGKQKFARDEGGIIMCMPKAKGPIYASSKKKYRLGKSVPDKGRQQRYCPAHIVNANSWFPVRQDAGHIMSKVCEEDGVLNCLAFDDKFGDNGGAYTVKLVITRPRTMGNSHEECRQLLNDVDSDDEMLIEKAESLFANGELDDDDDDDDEEEE